MVVVQFCQPAWSQVTSDPWVLEMVKGYQLGLIQTPVQIGSVLSKASSGMAGNKCRNPGSASKAGHNSGTTMYRPVHQQAVCDPEERRVTMSCDTYLLVPIARQHKKFLRLGTIFEFICLPFGLCSAPKIFMKVLRPVMACLHFQGLRTVIYLDDILILAENIDTLIQQVHYTVHHHNGGTMVAFPGLVSNSDGELSGASSATPEPQRPTKGPTQSIPPTGGARASTTSRLQSIRNTTQQQEFQRKLLTSCWQDGGRGTNPTYQSGWGR